MLTFVKFGQALDLIPFVSNCHIKAVVLIGWLHTDHKVKTFHSTSFLAKLLFTQFTTAQY